MTSDLEKAIGGAGCDIVTAANSLFTPRLGKIYVIVVREDATTIDSITEDVNGTATLVTSRSWIGGESSGVYVSLNVNDILTPDHPVSRIDVASGSVLVYHTKGDWKHVR